MRKVLFTIVFVLFALAAFGQVVTGPFITPKPQFFSSNGKVLAGGKLYFYAAGTSTPQNTYTSSAGTVANSNPVILDSGGFPQSTEIWLGPYSYKIVAKSSTGVTQWTSDNVTSLAKLNVASAGTYTNSAINWQNTILDGLTKDNITTLQSGLFLTDVLDIGQLTPSDSTVYQADGIGVFTQVNSAATNQVSIYSQCMSGVDHAKCWGYNGSVNDYDVNGTSFANVTLHGIELDVNAKDSSTGGDAIFIQGNLAGNTLGNVGAINIPKPAAGTWGYGLILGDQSLLSSTAPAIQIGAPALTSSTSYPLVFRSYNSLGVANVVRMYANEDGAINVPRLSTFGASTTGMSDGDIVLANAGSLKSESAAHNSTYNLIAGNGSNQVVLDPSAQGTVVAGNVAVTGKTTLTGGVAADSAGFKHKRFGGTTATAASSFSTQTTTFTWTTAFADTNYTVSCTPVGAATGTPIFQGVVTKTNATVIVQVMAGTAVASSFAGVDCVAVHD
jgi:hypothetical protein